MSDSSPQVSVIIPVFDGEHTIEKLASEIETALRDKYSYEVIFIFDRGTGDVRHIGHALNTAPTRMPVKWENTETGYQFSLMVFSSDAAMGTATRKFTVLTIEPSGEAEILNLVGTSTKKNVWHIVAETPAAYVGKAARMELAETPIPDATLSSNQRFTGFIVAN